MIDGEDELARERLGLIAADRHICEGEERIIVQEELLASLVIRGEGTTEAVALLDLFRGILEQWQWHRQLIVARIAQLETQQQSVRRASPAEPPFNASDGMH